MAKAVPLPLPALGAQLPEGGAAVRPRVAWCSLCTATALNQSQMHRQQRDQTSILLVTAHSFHLLKRGWCSISLQPCLPVPTEYIQPCCDFLLLLLLLHLPPPSPRQKTSGKPAISLFQGWLFITALLPFIFAPVCVPARAPPVSSLIFTVCWGGKCFSIYWHIYLMCFAAHGVIKQRLSPSKQCKLHLTPNFPCRPSTSSVTRSVHKAICNRTDA